MSLTNNTPLGLGINKQLTPIKCQIEQKVAVSLLQTTKPRLS